MEACPICGNPLAIDRLQYDDGSLSTCMDCEACEFRRLHQWGCLYLSIGHKSFAAEVEHSEQRKRRVLELFKRRLRKCRRTWRRTNARPWVHHPRVAA